MQNNEVRNEIEKMFQKISSIQGVTQLVIFDSNNRILRTNVVKPSSAKEIVHKSNNILETIFSTLKKYGSGGRISLISVRMNTEKGNIYIIKGKHVRIAFLQKAKLLVDEEKAIQILEKIQNIVARS